MTKRKGFTNPVTDGIKGFANKGNRYLEKEIYYFPFNVTVPLNLFIKANGSYYSRSKYPQIEANYPQGTAPIMTTPKDNFPLMTSNTTPGPFYCQASTNYGVSQGYDMYKAFNKLVNPTKNIYNAWHHEGKPPGWVELVFPGIKVKVNGYRIGAKYGDNNGAYQNKPKTWTIVGYPNIDNNEGAVVLDSRADQNVPQNGHSEYVCVTTPLESQLVYFSRLRLTVSAIMNGGTSPIVPIMRFYSITEDEFIDYENNLVIYNNSVENFYTPNLINYEDSTQGYICLREHVATYR